MKPLVSVIIPTYQRKSFVCDAIRSVVSQSFAEIEIVVVDDGSDDGTRWAVSAIEDDRIVYLWQKHAGVSSARNEGVLNSRGKFVAFLDSDDVWLPEKIERQLAFMNGLPADSICQTEEIWIRDGKRMNPSNHHKKHSGWIFKECLPLCIVSPSAVMMERRIFDELGGFDENLPACEDYDLWLRASLRHQIFTMEEALIVKRGGHSDQLSKQWGLDIHRVSALQKILSDPLLTEEYAALVRADIVRRSKILADGARKRGNLDMFEKYSRLCEEPRSPNS